MALLDFFRNVISIEVTLTVIPTQINFPLTSPKFFLHFNRGDL